mgnify:CR=1 FL=1
MGGIVVALTIGFLLGILLMVLLVSGQEEEKLVERVEQVEDAKRIAQSAER